MVIDLADENTWVLDLPIVKQGTSLGITIPKRSLSQLGLQHGDKAKIILRRKGEEG